MITMTTKGFEKIQTPGITINRIQDKIQRAVNDVHVGKISDGHLIKCQVKVNEVVKVAHKLGRKPLGWVQVSPNNLEVFVIESSPPDSTYLNLTMFSASFMVADIVVWVF